MNCISFVWFCHGSNLKDLRLAFLSANSEPGKRVSCLVRVAGNNLRNSFLSNFPSFFKGEAVMRQVWLKFYERYGVEQQKEKANYGLHISSWEGCNISTGWSHGLPSERRLQYKSLVETLWTLFNWSVISNIISNIINY